jgi:hypothetical protein
MKSTEELLEALIDETCEESVFIFLTTIAAAEVTDRESAVSLLNKDIECMSWLVMTLKMIPLSILN